MKELLISHDSNTFTSALKGIRSNPSIASSSHKTSRSNQSGFMQKPSLSHTYSPRVNIIKRKNLTLRQLYAEYQSNPHTQYVIRLKNQASIKNGSGTFDHWISNLKQPQQCSLKYSITEQSTIPNSQTKQQIRQKLEKQISQSLLKMGSKMQKKESQSTQQSIKQQGTSLNRQTKYSFSDYFSEYLPHQNRETFPQTQLATKISITNDKNINELPQTASKKQSARQFSDQYGGKDMLSKDENKQNIRTGLNQMPSQTRKVVGLQFSKNKRFKSTKKKRKN